MSHAVSGVWFSLEPLSANEGAMGDVVLKVELPLSEDDLAHHELIEEGKPYREFVIPHELVNHPGVKITVDEIYSDEITTRTGLVPLWVKAQTKA